MAGYTELAAEMISMTDPYKLKNFGDGINVKKTWAEMEQTILDEIIQAKFDQNPKCKIKLLEDGYASYHEMMTERKWGTGKRIPYETTPLDRKALTGGNKGGLAITRLQNQYCRALGLQMPVVPTSTESTQYQEDKEADTSEFPGTPGEGYIQEINEVVA